MERLKVLMFVALICSVPAMADFTAVGSDWNTPGDWSPAGTPTNSDGVFMSSGLFQENPLVANIHIEAVNGCQ